MIIEKYPSVYIKLQGNEAGEKERNKRKKERKRYLDNANQNTQTMWNASIDEIVHDVTEQAKRKTETETVSQNRTQKRAKTKRKQKQKQQH